MGTGFDDQLGNNIRLLQNAGKNVLISFGGVLDDKLTTAAYKHYAGNVQDLVNQIAAFVNNFHFNGVDIDYEDDAGFGNNAAYDGVGFLSELTNGLYQALPLGRNIITHAPQTPYWDSHSIYARGGTPPYFQIWKNVGTKIAWFNNQFYDNQDYDKDAATKVEKYQAVAGLIGAQQLLMGVSLSGDEGAETLSDMVQNVIPPLKAKYGSQFGGVMGWQFSNDQGGAWANGIKQALAPPQPWPGPSSNLFIFYQGGNQYSGQLWYTTYDGTNWGQNVMQNLGMSGSPSAALWKGGISVFHQGANNDGQLWYTYSSDGNNWGNPKTDSIVPVSGLQMSGSPSVVEYNGRLYIFFQGGNQYQDQLWYVTFDGTNWAERQVPNLGMSGSPSAAVWKGGITVFHQGSSNDGQLWYTYSSDGNNWGSPKTDSQVLGRIISASPSCVVL